MKLLYSLFFLIITHTAFTQPYKSLFTPGKISSWNVYSGTIPGNTESYKISKDTFANGHTWRYFGEKTALSGLLREDTLTGKVWFKGVKMYSFLITDTSEKLVCDFSLHVGDSFHYHKKVPVGNGNFIEKDGWLHVDSVFYIDNLKHIRFDTTGIGKSIVPVFNDGTYLPFVMIEGVGTPRLFHFMTHAAVSSYLQCHYRDTDLFYMSRYSTVPNNCNVQIIAGIEDKFSGSDYISIYPNPTNGKLFIEGNHTILRVTVFNSSGMKVRETSSLSEVDLSGMPKSLYLLHIETNDGLITQKVILE